MKVVLGIYLFFLLLALMFGLYVLGSVKRAPDLHPSKPIAQAQYLVKKTSLVGHFEWLGWTVKVPKVGLRAKIVKGWTPDLRFVWRYSDWQNAHEVADRYNGEVVRAYS